MLSDAWDIHGSPNEIDVLWTRIPPGDMGKEPEEKIVWRCNNRLINAKESCTESVTIEESVLNHAVMSTIHKIARNEGDFLGAFRENVIRIIGNYGQVEEKDEYEDKIKEKQQEMVDLIAENAKTGAYSEAFDRWYSQ